MARSFGSALPMLKGSTMAIDSIGSIVNNGSASAQSSNTIDQDGFIKLFLSQLQFQDPLEPVDNREFLAQLAQFSNLEQSRQLSLNSEGMLSMNATSQSLSLLSRRIEVTQASGNTATGVVKAIEFSASGPLLTVETSAGVLTGIRLPQITLVQQ